MILCSYFPLLSPPSIASSFHPHGFGTEEEEEEVSLRIEFFFSEQSVSIVNIARVLYSCIFHFCDTCSLCRVELVIQFPARGSTQVLLCLFPSVLWLWQFLYSVGPQPVSSLHIYTFVVSRAFMAGAASELYRLCIGENASYLYNSKKL